MVSVILIYTLIILFQTEQDLEKKINRLNEEISIRDKQIEAKKENIDKIKKTYNVKQEEYQRIISQKENSKYKILLILTV